MKEHEWCSWDCSNISISWSASQTRTVYRPSAIYFWFLMVLPRLGILYFYQRLDHSSQPYLKLVQVREVILWVSLLHVYPWCLRILKNSRYGSVFPASHLFISLSLARTHAESNLYVCINGCFQAFLWCSLLCFLCLLQIFYWSHRVQHTDQTLYWSSIFLVYRRISHLF
jgi:hypothetical protein